MPQTLYYFKGCFLIGFKMYGHGYPKPLGTPNNLILVKGENVLRKMRFLSQPRLQELIDLTAPTFVKDWGATVAAWGRFGAPVGGVSFEINAEGILLWGE